MLGNICIHEDAGIIYVLTVLVNRIWDSFPNRMSITVLFLQHGISFLASTRPSKHIKAGHYRPASETPFKWRFAGGPMVAPDSMLAEEMVYAQTHQIDPMPSARLEYKIACASEQRKL